MKDRNAFTDNKVERGVDPDEAKTPRVFGVPAGAHPGLVPAQYPQRGVAENEVRGNILRSDYYVIPKKKLPPSCSGINKKGLPCKAHPALGGQFCIGHQKQNDVRGN